MLDVAIGARPNSVKAAALFRAFRARAPRGLALSLVHTGQHSSAAMAGEFGRALGLPEPDVQLDTGGAKSHGAQTAAILARYEAHLLARRPRGVIVFGDVNSTLACALAAAKLAIPVVHVEAGLRCFDRDMPEELNRALVDRVSRLLLASEPSAVENLAREGFDPRDVRLVGSLTVDTLLHELPAARALAVHERHGLAPAGYAFVTLHRPANVDDPARLRAITEALSAVADRIPVVFPAHPRTARRLAEARLLERLRSRAIVLEPLPYRESVGLMSAARVVVTDSGGVQEETTALGVPCLTLRPSTERPITLERGTNTLVPDPAALPGLVERAAARPTRTIACWDGRAAERAVDALLERLS
ncbi:MAG TPA: UDP-N-acetylglucosamine 2-epimerase (non-hydrolyzing) [Sandaracinaceae bacterium]